MEQKHSAEKESQEQLEALLGKPAKGKGRRKKILLLGGVTLLLGAAAAALVFFMPKAQETDSETVYREYTVEYGDITVGQSESSSISLTRETVTFPVSAEVEEVYVRAGSSVKAGEPLVRLDVEDIEAGLSSYELQLEIAGLELEQAKLQLETRLLEAKQKLESSELGGELAETNEENTLDNLSLELQSAQTTLLRAQQEFAEYCELNATFASDYNYLAYLENMVDYYTEEESGYSSQQSLVSGYETQLAAAQKEYTQLQQTLNSGKTLSDYQQAMTNAEAAMATAQANQATAQAALETAQADRAAASAEATAEEITQLDAAISTAQMALDQAAVDYAAAQTAYVDAESGYNSLLNAEAQLNSVLDTINNLQSQINASGSSSSLGSLAASSKADLADAKEAYEEFKSYVNERYGNIDDWQTLMEKIEDAETAVEKAELNLSKAEANSQTGALSAEQAKETALTQSETAKTTYELTEMELSQAVDAAQEEYDYLADQIEEVKSLVNEDGVVYASCNGMIASVNVEAGDSVSVMVNSETNQIMAYAQLLVMTNISDVYVPITISEEDILDVSIGQEASVTMTAFPNQTFDAMVDTITVESSRSGAATVSYNVNIRFAEENQLDMYEGMSAEVTLIQRRAQDVLYVNVQAVTNTNGIATVLKKGADGSGVETVVTTGFSDGRYVEILSGLLEGDVVLVESAVGRQ